GRHCSGTLGLTTTYPDARALRFVQLARSSQLTAGVEFTAGGEEHSSQCETSVGVIDERVGWLGQGHGAPGERLGLAMLVPPAEDLGPHTEQPDAALEVVAAQRWVSERFCFV